MFIIRPYIEADYDGFARINEATQSQAYWGEADWFGIHPPCEGATGANRYVAVDAKSSQMVGYGAVLMEKQANLDVMVHPDWQRQGVGTLLWERMRQDLSAFDTSVVGPWVRAENTAGCRWLSALGFSHVNKEGPVQLEVENADLSLLVPNTAHQTNDIVFTTLADEHGRPDCLEKVYDLFQNVENDVPTYSPANRTSFEQFVQELQQSGIVPQSVFIAKHNEAYIGLSILGQRISEADMRFAGGPGCLSQHLTGVRAPYRRRGIAFALKLRTIEYAQKHGYRRILSNSDNPAMRDLNWKLGFRTGPWFIYNKHLEQAQTV